MVDLTFLITFTWVYPHFIHTGIKCLVRHVNKKKQKTYIIGSSCLKVVFSPRRCEGIGLSDGETMERLWSYLRRFGRMTKEMRPTHRIDVLTSALVFYGIKTKEKLGA